MTTTTRLFNLARMTVSSSGTGVITLNSAVSGFATFAQTGVSAGGTVSYAISDTNQSEIGVGIYSSGAGLTLGSTGGGATRTPIMNHTGTSSAIAMSNAAQVFITPNQTDWPFLLDVAGTSAFINKKTVFDFTALGLTAPPNATHPWAFVGATTDCVLGMWGWGVANNPATISMNYTNTNTSPTTHTAVTTGQWLGLIGANGSTGATFEEGARIIIVADGNYAVGSSPGRMIFGTVPTGSTTWAERVRLDQGGKMTIGNAVGTQSGGQTVVTTATPMLQITDTALTGLIDLISAGGATATSSFLSFTKNRGTTPASVATVVSGDFLGFISFTGANGTNVQQAAYILGSSDGVPSATSMPGRLSFATTPAGSNGSTLRMWIDNKGSVAIGDNSSTLATGATDGFLYIPTCAGTPTGAPTAHTGTAPIIINTTNNKLYFYSGGAWRDAGP